MRVCATRDFWSHPRTKAVGPESPLAYASTIKDGAELAAFRRFVRGRRYLVTPTVSRTCVFDFVDGESVVDSTLVALSLDDDFDFGVLQSGVHALWVRHANAGKGEHLRYSLQVFASFPRPWPRGSARALVAARGRHLRELRSYLALDRGLSPNAVWQGSESEEPTTTRLAHARHELDQAVLEAYGWGVDRTDSAKILDSLIKLNEERSTQ
ncbi:MAG: hypothetical protein QM765_38955 [Myxococcales bacterium]